MWLVSCCNLIFVILWDDLLRFVGYLLYNKLHRKSAENRDEVMEIGRYGHGAVVRNRNEQNIDNVGTLCFLSLHVLTA